MVKIKAAYLGDSKIDCTHESGAVIQTDIPKDIGGDGKLFSPTDLFAASLGTCMLSLMGLAAKKVGFDLKGATAEIEKIMSTSPPRKIAKIVVRIRCPKAADAEIQAKLEQAALHCPVHLSLHPDIQEEIDFVWGL